MDFLAVSVYYGKSEDAMKTVCGIDLGTQSCKIVLYDFENKCIITQATSMINMIAESGGIREQKAEWYEEALEICFGKIASETKKSIVAIGVSGQQHSLVPLDEKGKAVYNVKLWCDTSTTAECEELTEMAGGEKKLIAKTGLPMRTGYTAPKIQWLKNRKPKAFSKMRHILLPHNYINYLLTGTICAEYGDASGTALFDVRKRTWASSAFDLISPDLESMLPPLVKPDASAGRVSKAAAALYGLPEGVLVSAGGGDNMMSAIGTGTVEDGVLAMSLGTSGTLFGYSDKPVIDPTGSLAAFCSSTGGWLPLLCTMNCTVASEEFRRLFNLEVKAFDEEASKAPVGSEGIIVLPFFNGERTPNLPNGKASINGITATNFKKENLARAALESAIFGMRIGLDRFAELGFKAKEIRLTGGGSKSPIWQRMAANITKLPVRIPAGTEAAAMGAAIQALWCFQSNAGIKPNSITALAKEHVVLDAEPILHDKKEAAAYDKAYADYSSYLEAVSPLYL